MKVVLFREAPRSPPVLCMAAHNVADPVCGTLFVDLDLVVDYKKQGGCIRATLKPNTFSGNRSRLPYLMKRI